MRKIWKYIGILLIINCAVGSFAIERANNIPGVEANKNFKDLDDCAQDLAPIKKPRDIKSFTDILIQSNFGIELFASFNRILFNKNEKTEEIHMNILIQKTIDKVQALEKKFRDGEIYDLEGSISMIEEWDNNLLIRYKSEKIVENNFNYLTLYEEAIFDENIFLDKILKHNKVCPYKQLYKKVLSNGNYNKNILKQKFSDIWKDGMKPNYYFTKITAPFFKAMKKNDLEEAFIQLNLKFSILKEFLGKENMGIPNSFQEFNDCCEYDVILFNLVEWDLKKKNKKKNSCGFLFQKTYKGVSFDFDYIVFRMEFVKLFSKAVIHFMNHPDFFQWTETDENFTEFICFQSFFLEPMFGIAIPMELVESLSCVRSEEEIAMNKNILLNQYIAKEIRKDILDKTKIQSKKQNEIFYQVDQFKIIMNDFNNFCLSVFEKYLMNKLLWPSKEEFQLMYSSKSQPIILTTLEKNTLNLTEKLNIILKSFFQNPSSNGFKKTLSDVNKIKDKFLNLTMDLRLKHHKDEINMEMSWFFFLKHINPENLKLYHKFLTNGNQYQSSEEEEKKQDFNEFSKKNMKQMSENQRKTYKKQSNSMAKPSEDPQQQQKQESMVVSESQKLILEARENFNNITKNKIDIYNSYKSSIKKVKNTIDICLNLINKKGINEKNQLKSLIKEMDLLKENSQPLENIKDEINDTQKYEDDSFPIELDSSYNLNKINQLIKKENAKVHQFNRMIGLLTEAGECLNEFIAKISQQDMEDTSKVVVFENKKFLYSRATEQEPFHQSGHIPNPKGKPGQEGPTARLKKKKRKNEEVTIAFQDAVDQEKEMEEAIKQLEKQQEKGRKKGDKMLNEKIAKKNQEQIQQIVTQIQNNIY